MVVWLPFGGPRQSFAGLSRAESGRCRGGSALRRQAEGPVRRRGHGAAQRRVSQRHWRGDMPQGLACEEEACGGRRCVPAPRHSGP